MLNGSIFGSPPPQCRHHMRMAPLNAVPHERLQRGWMMQWPAVTFQDFAMQCFSAVHIRKAKVVTVVSKRRASVAVRSDGLFHLPYLSCLPPPLETFPFLTLCHDNLFRFKPSLVFSLLSSDFHRMSLISVQRTRTIFRAPPPKCALVESENK